MYDNFLDLTDTDGAFSNMFIPFRRHALQRRFIILERDQTQ